MPVFMKRQLATLFVLITLSLSLVHAGVTAAPLAITISNPPPAESDYFRLGSTRRPDGLELNVDSYSLRLDGKPWLPMMGEFQYSRYPESEWREALLKIKAGGVDIVSSYVFWLHHEEVEGQFDWSGRRDLHRFLQTCQDVGLYVIVRCGPWCHGEARNGGLPDWVQQRKGQWKLRSTDTNFLAAVSVFYNQIAGQLKGMLWKDGGPVIGLQVDNEYHGSPDYLVALKGIARLAGIDVPFYTRTGWPPVEKTPPLGALLPFYGTYPDGFWERDLEMMTGDKWTRFAFSKQRIDANIANDIFGKLEPKEDDDTFKYPYFTCELGGGMETSYHRRIVVYPDEVESLLLTKLGAGVNLPGFYMYHGGINPEGKLSTLNESQATGYPNDMPVKHYDWGSPLGEYGQMRPQYHGLRRLGLFLRDYGPALTRMSATLPEIRPTTPDQIDLLRWAVRSDGRGGYIFVNNFQRLQTMPAKNDVQFKLELPGEKMVVPAQPITVPADSYFIWPFNQDLGAARLVYATAQPVCQLDERGVRTLFFAETPGIPAEFMFKAGKTSIKAPSGKVKKQGDRVLVQRVRAGRGVAIQLKPKSGKRIQIVLLSQADSLALWKGEWDGQQRVILSPAGVVFDSGTVRLTAENPDDLVMDVLPAPKAVQPGSAQLCIKADGVFRQFKFEQHRTRMPAVEVKKIQSAGPLRTISLGRGKSPVAVGPSDGDFDQAAVWRIKLPAEVDLSRDPMLRINYVGDVARVLLNGKLLDDNFYNGSVFEVALRSFAPEILKGDLRLAVLPLQKDAPIYLAKEAQPDFGSAKSVVELRGVELVEPYKASLSVGN